MSLIHWLKEIRCFGLAEDQKMMKKYMWYFQPVCKSGIDCTENRDSWGPDSTLFSLGETVASTFKLIQTLGMT